MLKMTHICLFLITISTIACFFCNSINKTNEIVYEKGWPKNEVMLKKYDLIITLPQKVNDKCSEVYRNNFMSKSDVEKLISAFNSDPHRSTEDQISYNQLCSQQNVIGIAICRESSSIKDEGYLQSGDSITYFYKNSKKEYIDRYLKNSIEHSQVIYYSIK
jgi:hypothetical protein